ncbi:MAG: hypothetical protein ACRC7O_02210 [Fimbriiglobus sp.]
MGGYGKNPATTDAPAEREMQPPNEMARWLLPRLKEYADKVRNVSERIGAMMRA